MRSKFLGLICFVSLSVMSCRPDSGGSTLDAHSMEDACATDVLASVGRLTRFVDDNTQVSLVSEIQGARYYMVTVYPQFSDGASSVEFPPQTFAVKASGDESACSTQGQMELPVRDCVDLAMQSARFVEAKGVAGAMKETKAVVVKPAGRNYRKLPVGNKLTYIISVSGSEGRFSHDPEAGNYTVTADGNPRECRISSIVPRRLP